MKDEHLVLIINPGSTSTKIALFKKEQEVFSVNISHNTKELSRYKKITDEYEFRKDIILKVLKDQNIDINNLSAIVGRGGLLKPISSGTYEVNDEMIKDLKEAKNGEHASNLGAILAYTIANDINVKSYIVDPVVVDEMIDVARISGNPNIPRKSIFHALNQKAVARRASTELGKKYSELNLIVAHLGGGISVGLHEKGNVIDVNNALDGEGPFSPERSGSVPVGELVKLCFSGKYSQSDIKKQIKGSGGLVAYLGTNDAREVQKRFENNDKDAVLVYSAMAYQIAKEIGGLATVVKGNVDAIVLTGGLAYDEILVSMISKRVDFISRIILIPGEKEMESLRDGALRVLYNEEKVRIYK